jgi:hypothetical protein
MCLKGHVSTVMYHTGNMYGSVYLLKYRFIISMYTWILLMIWGRTRFFTFEIWVQKITGYWDTDFNTLIWGQFIEFICTYFHGPCIFPYGVLRISVFSIWGRKSPKKSFYSIYGVFSFERYFLIWGRNHFAF